MDVLLKEKLLQILDVFVDVCNENGLKYYLAYGSLLGAVRHKGFIPWDEDIDVFMLRKDYEILKSVKFPDNYKLSSYELDKSYTYDTTKLELTTTTHIERIQPDYIGGIFIDIFPLDFAPNCDRKRRYRTQIVNIVKKRVINTGIRRFDECSTFVDYLFLRIRKKYFLGLYLSLYDYFSKLTKTPTYYLQDYHNRVTEFPIEVFGDGAIMPFEGRNCIVPSDYHTFLKKVYGDYMTFPPEDKRHPVHDVLYLNLERRLNESELDVILDKVNKDHAYKPNIKRVCKQILKKFGVKF